MSEGRYRRLYANEWLDPAFRRLDDGARIVRLYVSAGTQTTSCGCFRLSTAVAVEELGGTAEDFERRLGAVCASYGWDWDPVARVLWISDWFERNPPANPNVVNSWAKLVRNVPHCDVKIRAVTSIGNSLKSLSSSYREPWAELLKSFPKAESQTEPLQGSGSSDQGTESRRAARGDGGYGHEAGRASDVNDEQLRRLVKQTLQLVDIRRPLEELVDAFHQTARNSGVKDHFTKEQIEAAFESERRSVTRGFTPVAHLARAVSK